MGNRLRSTKQRFVIRHQCAVTDRAKLPLLREGLSAPAGENWRRRNHRGRGLGRGAGCQRWKRLLWRKQADGRRAAQGGKPRESRGTSS